MAHRHGGQAEQGIEHGKKLALNPDPKLPPPSLEDTVASMKAMLEDPENWRRLRGRNQRDDRRRDDRRGDRPGYRSQGRKKK